MNYGHSTGFLWPRLTQGVKLLMIVNAAVFVLNAILVSGLTPLLALSWSAMWEGYGLGLLRLVTYQFTHDFGSAFHIFMNMLMLYFFGTFVEEAIGKVRLLRLCLVAGVVGGIAHVLLSMVMQHDAPVVGFSGCVYGVMVYAACMAPRMRVLLIVFPIELRWLVGVMVFFGIYSTYVELVAGTGGGVSHGGHLGGALWGFLAFRMPSVRFRWFDRVLSWRQARVHRSQQERQSILDQLLDKVHREGMTALTPAERRFLNKASQEMRGR